MVRAIIYHTYIYIYVRLYIYVYILLGHGTPGINGVHPIVRHISDAVVKTELFRSQEPHRQRSFEAMEAVTCWAWGQVLRHILMERGSVGKRFTRQFLNIVLILVMHSSRAVSSQNLRFVPATWRDEKSIIMTGKSSCTVSSSSGREVST